MEEGENFVAVEGRFVALNLGWVSERDRYGGRKFHVREWWEHVEREGNNCRRAVWWWE